MDREDKALLYVGSALLATILCGPTVAIVTDDTPKYSPAYQTDQARRHTSEQTPEPPSSTDPNKAINSAYIIQPGDTLLKIAGRYGVSVGAIKKANGLNSDQINAWNTLTIPGADFQARSQSDQSKALSIESPAQFFNPITGTCHVVGNSGTVFQTMVDHGMPFGNEGIRVIYNRQTGGYEDFIGRDLAAPGVIVPVSANSQVCTLP